MTPFTFMDSVHRCRRSNGLDPGEFSSSSLNCWVSVGRTYHGLKFWWEPSIFLSSLPFFATWWSNIWRFFLTLLSRRWKLDDQFWDFIFSAVLERMLSLLTRIIHRVFSKRTSWRNRYATRFSCSGDCQWFVIPTFRFGLQQSRDDITTLTSFRAHGREVNLVSLSFKYYVLPCYVEPQDKSYILADHDANVSNYFSYQ